MNTYSLVLMIVRNGHAGVAEPGAGAFAFLRNNFNKLR